MGIVLPRHRVSALGSRPLPPDLESFADPIADPADDVVIVIARDPRLLLKLVRTTSAPVRCFLSIRDLERSLTAAENCERFALQVRQLVTAVQTPEPMPPQLQLAIQWLERQPCVPALKVFAEAVCPRRTFFRLWGTAMRESPARFLNRLRAACAVEMLRSGGTVDDVMRRCGCRSPAELRQLVDRWW